MGKITCCGRWRHCAWLNVEDFENDTRLDWQPMEVFQGRCVMVVFVYIHTKCDCMSSLQHTCMVYNKRCISSNLNEFLLKTIMLNLDSIHNLITSHPDRALFIYDIKPNQSY